MHIGIPLSKFAYTPEAYAYEKYHNPETIYNSYMSIWNKDRCGDDFK